MRFGTFSILGYDPISGDVGIAVATAIPTVGMFVPYTRAEVGTLANQALTALRSSKGAQAHARRPERVGGR